MPRSLQLAVLLVGLIALPASPQQTPGSPEPSQPSQYSAPLTQIGPVEVYRQMKPSPSGYWQVQDPAERIPKGFRPVEGKVPPANKIYAQYAVDSYTQASTYQSKPAAQSPGIRGLEKRIDTLETLVRELVDALNRREPAPKNTVDAPSPVEPVSETSVEPRRRRPFRDPAVWPVGSPNRFTPSASGGPFPYQPKAKNVKNDPLVEVARSFVDVDETKIPWAAQVRYPKNWQELIRRPDNQGTTTAPQQFDPFEAQYKVKPAQGGSWVYANPRSVQQTQPSERDAAVLALEEQILYLGQLQSKVMGGEKIAKPTQELAKELGKIKANLEAVLNHIRDGSEGNEAPEHNPWVSNKTKGAWLELENNWTQKQDPPEPSTWPMGNKDKQ